MSDPDILYIAKPYKLDLVDLFSGAIRTQKLFILKHLHITSYNTCIRHFLFKFSPQPSEAHIP